MYVDIIDFEENIDDFLEYVYSGIEIIVMRDLIPAYKVIPWNG